MTRKPPRSGVAVAAQRRRAGAHKDKRKKLERELTRVWHTCALCHGSGEDPVVQNCPECGGLGRVECWR